MQACKQAVWKMQAQKMQAVLLQRVHHQEPAISNGEEAMELATREGARFMGIESGFLAPGRLADMAVIKLGGPSITPNHRALASVVYSASPADVMYTIVGGTVILEEGRCTLIDEDEVLQEAQGRAEELIERAGLAAQLEPWRSDLLPS